MSTVLRRKPLLCLISCHLVTRQQVLLNHCLVPQRAPSTSRNCQWVTIRCPAQLLISITVRPAHSYCQWGTTEEVIKSRVVWWSSDGEWEKRQIQAFFWRGWRSPNFGSVGELEGPRNRLKTTTCSAPEPSLRPSTSLGPGLEERWRSPPSLSLQPASSGRLSGSQFVRTNLPIWTAWGDWGPIGLGAWLCQEWDLERMWELGPEGAADWDLLPLNQDWDISGWKLCLETLPFLVSTENNIHLIEIYRNFITWPWPHLKNKGSDTKKSATTSLNSL